MVACSFIISLGNLATSGISVPTFGTSGLLGLLKMFRNKKQIDTEPDPTVYCDIGTAPDPDPAL